VFDLHHVRYRSARGSDAPANAALHADSWRRHYRGAYSNAFLDGEVTADRSAVWTSQLHHHQPEQCTIVAEAGDIVGFAHTILDDDPTWGRLLTICTLSTRFRAVGSALNSWPKLRRLSSSDTGQLGSICGSSNRTRQPKPFTKRAAVGASSVASRFRRAANLPASRVLPKGSGTSDRTPLNCFSGGRAVPTNEHSDHAGYILAASGTRSAHRAAWPHSCNGTAGSRPGLMRGSSTIAHGRSHMDERSRPCPLPECPAGA
jgi:hypothetical protein